MTPLHYSAKMHQVDVTWRLRTTADVEVGPTPRLVLALRARRDVELLLLRVDFPALRTEEGYAESTLAQVDHVVGLRRLRPEGEPLVWGQEATGATGQGPVSELRWDGRPVEALLHNTNPHPCDYWVWRGRVLVPKGTSVGLVVTADRPTACRAKFAGV